MTRGISADGMTLGIMAMQDGMTLGSTCIRIMQDGTEDGTILTGGITTGQDSDRVMAGLVMADLDTGQTMTGSRASIQAHATALVQTGYSPAQAPSEAEVR